MGDNILNWMAAFLEGGHGWGQQRVAARLGDQRTQAVGNCGGMPLSVADMRPSKIGLYSSHYSNVEAITEYLYRNHKRFCSRCFSYNDRKRPPSPSPAISKPLLGKHSGGSSFIFHFSILA